MPTGPRFLFSSSAVRPPALSPHPLWFLCGENEVVLRREPGPPVPETLPANAALLPSTAEVAALGLSREAAIFLGTLGGEVCLGLPYAGGKAALPPSLGLVGLRKLWSLLDETLFPIAGRANQLSHHYVTSAFCGRCGARNVRDPEPKSRAVKCPECALSVWPRISPAIITLVRRGDEALLANSGRFPIPFFSTLAGFSEPGESLEETLVREVHEEVGLKVANVNYFGSQSWPFPNSLMIGFTAQYESGEIAVDGEEIKEARFFHAHELPMIPPRLSIARKLIDAWVTEITGTPADAP
jgi:NAD+ diphosphatase